MTFVKLLTTTIARPTTNRLTSLHEAILQEVFFNAEPLNSVLEEILKENKLYIDKRFDSFLKQLF